MGQRLDLLTNASATGSYVEVVGGRYIWAAEGTFSSATLQLQFAGPNGTAIDIAGASLTANGAVEVMIADGSRIRVLVTGSPSAMYSTLVSVSA
jgi:hypothetical protein